MHQSAAPAALTAAPAAISPAEVTGYLLEDRDRIAQGMNDVVVQRIFSAGLTLQLALGLLGNQRGTREIRQAVDELDRAIRAIREIVFDLGPPAR
jgi:signal transduction histidine kinase